MVKLILFVVVLVIAYMIYTGNMGGAREATQNYVDVRTNKIDEKAAEGRPSPLHQLIEYKKQQQNK